MGRHIALHQRVAVGRRTQRVLTGNDAPAPTLVVHYKRLLEHLAPAFGNGSTEKVTASTRRNGHDVADRLVRKGGLCKAAKRQQCRRGLNHGTSFHRVVSW